MMSFDVQLGIVLAIVALAVVAVVRSLWKTFAGKKVGCGSGCGKCAAPTKAAPQKGRIELPQV
jgi:bacterioferritin-associated ferredoxin